MVEAWCKEMKNQEQRNWESRVGRRGEGVPRVQLRFKSLLRWYKEMQGICGQQARNLDIKHRFCRFFALILLTKVP